MRRAALRWFVLLAVLAAPATASASDASLEHSLSGYQSKLTADIGFLASFSTPSRAGAGGVLARVSTVQSDLAGATRAASGQQASSGPGRQGRTLVLSALGEASTAASDARAAAADARAGNGSAARGAAGRERAAIAQAIPRFEQGGRLLHLF